MVQKAKKIRTSADRFKAINDHKSTLYALSRRSQSPVTSGSAFLSNFGGSAGGSTSAAGNYLQTKGDTMVGPIAFFPKVTTISNGQIDISEQAGAYSSRIIVSPQSGSTDNLLTITGAGFAGQLLFLQGVATDTITIIDSTSDQTDWITGTSYSLDDIRDNGGNVYVCKSAHTSGGTSEPGVGATWETYWYKANIETIEGTDFTLEDDDILVFMYDTTDTAWQQITAGKQGVGGATSPLGVKGDIWAYSTGDAAFPIGATDGHALVVDAASAFGFKWAAVGAGSIPSGMTENEHLEWDNVGGTWVAVPTLTHGTTGPFADSGFNRFANDAIMLSARNIADDGNLEFKVDSGDFFDFTESNNGPVSLKIRAQHATNPDNTLTITQLSGTTGVGQFFAPNEMQFLGSGSSNVFNYDQNRIVTNVNINPDADGTINLGGTILRYSAVHASSFKFDTNRRLDFNTGGGGITVDGVLDSFTINVDSLQKASFAASLTTLSGAVDITGLAGINDKAEFAEITAPAGDPDVNTGWMYGKVVGGTHTEPFWEDELGTVTNLLEGREFFGPWTADHDAGDKSLTDLAALQIVDTGGVSRGTISGDSGASAIRLATASGGKFIISDVITDIAEFTDAVGLKMLGSHVLNMNTNTINTIGEAQFDTTSGFSPTSATTIGFDTTGNFLKYNVGLTTDAHAWYAAGELLASLTRIGSNSGQLEIDNLISDSVLQANGQLFFTDSATSPTANGEIRRTGTTIEAFVNGGVVDLADIGTGSGVTEGQDPVTWTGSHSFNGTTTAINSANINVGDAITDVVNIISASTTFNNTNAAVSIPMVRTESPNPVTIFDIADLDFQGETNAGTSVSYASFVAGAGGITDGTAGDGAQGKITLAVTESGSLNLIDYLTIDGVNTRINTNSKPIFMGTGDLVGNAGTDFKVVFKGATSPTTYITGVGGGGDDLNIFTNNAQTLEISPTGLELFADGHLTMDKRASDPPAATDTGIFYVKNVAGVSRPFFVGDGLAAVDLTTGGSGVTEGQDPVVWTGQHSFNGLITAINSPTISLGDQTTDDISIIGKVVTDIVIEAGNQITFEGASAADNITWATGAKNYVTDATGDHLFFIGGVSEFEIVAGAINQVDFKSKTGINLLDPSGAQDAATKAYVDAQVISGGAMFPIQPSVTDLGDTWTGTQTLNLGTGDGHVYKWIVDQDLTMGTSVTFPASLIDNVQRTFELEFVHDGVGGTFTVTLPTSPAFVDENGNTLTSFDIADGGRAILACRVNEGSGGNIIVLQKNVTAVSVVSGAHSLDFHDDVTITIANDKDYLRYNGSAWVDSPIVLTDISLTSASIILGDGTGTAADVAVTGDIGIDNTGLTTIQAGAVDIAMHSATGTPSSSTYYRGDNTWATIPSGSKHTIEDEGTPLTARTKLNFVGAGVSVADDAGDDATDVTITGGAEITLWTANHDANGNLLILDPDGDSSISSASDDSIQVQTGGSIRMSVDNTGVTVQNTLLANGDVSLGNASGDDINMNGQVTTDIDLSIGSRVDFNGSQSSVGSAGSASSLPSNPEGYIIVKHTGTEYVIPYYKKV